MQSISLCDTLTIEHAAEIIFNGAANNLVPRAARALNAFAGTACGANIRLVKRIPTRAGLGGGSADAAATLIALNRLWQLNLPSDALHQIALALGADVPFCLRGTPMRAMGIGELLQPIDIPHTYELVLLHPGGGLSTPAMFRAWDEEPTHAGPADTESAIRALQARDFTALQASARNMLQPCAVRALPRIDAALAALSRAGAKFVAMSGSGSAVFGAFDSAADADAAALSLGPAAIRAHTR